MNKINIPRLFRRNQIIKSQVQEKILNSNGLIAGILTCTGEREKLVELSSKLFRLLLGSTTKYF